MKAIVDVGTNFFDLNVVNILLPHFLDYYNSLGVKKFFLHGSDLIEKEVKNICKGYNIKYIPITKDQFLEYKNKELKLKDNENYCKNHVFSGSCPLWLISNDIKHQYIKKDEWSFILDLDEFVDLSADKVSEIKQSEADFVFGHMVDCIADKGGKIDKLVQDKPIKLQLNKLIHFSWFSGRSINKVSLTRGHVEHAFGHHAVLKKRPHNFKSFAPNGQIERAIVLHMKYFSQNMENILQSPHAKEAKYIDIESMTINSDLWKYFCSLDCTKDLQSDPNAKESRERMKCILCLDHNIPI